MREAVGIFRLNVMLTRRRDKHTLGLNEDTHLQINHKNERTRGFVHSSLISINTENHCFRFELYTASFDLDYLLAQRDKRY